MPRYSRHSPRRYGSPLGSDSDEFILCRWCRHAYKVITPTHIFWKHHRSFRVYAERFPSAPLFAPDTVKVMTRSIVANWERLGRHWTKDRVKEKIRQLRLAGHPLHALAIRMHQSKLYGAVLRIFGSWNAALRAAGIDPATVRRYSRWTTRTLIQAMRKAKKSGAFRRGASFRKRHSGLVQAATQRWGTWRAALHAAGLETLHPQSIQWTRPKVIAQIEARAAQGRSLLASEIHSHAPALRRAAEQLFQKDWPDLLRDLGYAYDGRRRWSKSKVVEELKRLQISGRKLNCEAVRRDNLALAQAAVRHFPTWAEALRAAGIDPAATKLRHWRRLELLQLFRTLRRSGNLSRRTLRDIQRPGYVQATSSIPKYWSTLDAALRDHA
jgi:hypothetical protein